MVDLLIDRVEQISLVDGRDVYLQSFCYGPQKLRRGKHGVDDGNDLVMFIKYVHKRPGKGRLSASHLTGQEYQFLLLDRILKPRKRFFMVFAQEQEFRIRR